MRKRKRFVGATLPQLDQTSADRYYRSSNVSVLPATPSHKLAVEQHQKVMAKEQPSSDIMNERDADAKYYRNPGQPRQLRRLRGGKMIRNHPLPEQGSQTQPVRHPQSVHPYAISDRATIDDVLSSAIMAVRGGQTRVIVQVANGLSLAVTTRLDMMVTRQRITEDERHRVAIQLLPKEKPPVTKSKAPADSLPSPEEAYVAPATTKPFTEDPSDFLKAADPVEEKEFQKTPAVEDEFDESPPKIETAQ
jgi:hypothetical protein